MKRRARILLVVAPLLCSATAAFAMTYPAWLDYEREADELKRQEAELAQVQNRLSQKAALDAAKRNLVGQIETLRGEMPRAPYLDLLMLDLERMATRSGADILAVEKESDNNTLGSQSDETDLELLEAARTRLKQPLKQAETKEKKLEERSGEPLLSGIKQMSRRVYLTGDFNELVGFVKELEAYKRVLAVRKLTIAMRRGDTQLQGEAAERAQKLKLDKPCMSFVLDIYYLP